ncbi:MAG TPA: spore germination protein [Calditerricola sp.]
MFLRLWRKFLRKPARPAKRVSSPSSGGALASELEENLRVLEELYRDCDDFVVRPFRIGNRRKALLFYLEGLSNAEQINEHILGPLMKNASEEHADILTLAQLRIPIAKVKPVHTVSACIEHLSNGEAVLLVDGETHGLACGLSKSETRAIDEPEAETVVRGPRDGFIETLDMNIVMLRRKIRSPRLKVKSLTVGRYTLTRIALVYIDGLTAPELIDEVEHRISRINIDGVLESGYLEEFIEDNPWSPFPQVLATERPDVAAASLLEGRMVILVDGTPFALVVPTTFFSLLQASEDYYNRFLIGTAIRWLRYAFVGIALLLPSLYVAIITYHQEMIPTTLLLKIATSRETVPFPALVEALLMETTFEILREAGVRLPRQIGAAISIVGALVIGEAAVSAGLASAPMVMVVAITGIASFAIPRYPAGISLRMLRFPIMILAGTLGLLGVMLGILSVAVHLCTLRSFGMPYLAPIAPTMRRDLRDVLGRAPWWALHTRPHFTGKADRRRQGPDQKPGPHRGGDT